MGDSTKSWPDADLELLRRRWAEGASDSQIVRDLGGRYTRNAVVGMRHRRGIQRGPDFARVQRAKPALNFSKRANKNRPRPHVPPVESREEVVLSDQQSVSGLDATPPPSETAGAVTLAELQPHHCRWVVGDATYCGARRVENRPYCAEHCDVAYDPKRPSKNQRPFFRLPR